MKTKTLIIFLISFVLLTFPVTNVSARITTSPDDISTMAAEQLKYCVFSFNGYVYLYDDSTGKVIKLLNLDKEVCNPVVSPDSSKIAYEEWNDDGLKISVYDIADKTSKEIELGDSAANSIMNIRWMNNETIGVEGHVNPSTAQFFVCDVKTCKVKNSYYGPFFTPSPDGKYVLFKENQPHFAEKSKPDRLCIDDQVVYEADDTSYEIEKPLFSKTSKKIAFIERNSAHSKLVIADVDLPQKKINNILKIEIDINVSGTLYFDDDDNPYIVNNDIKYQVDQQKLKLIESKNIIDKSIQEKKDAKISKFKNALISKFNKYITGDRDEIINNVVSNAQWMEKYSIAQSYLGSNNGIKVVYNKKPIVFNDVEPINKSGRVLIPLRAVMEDMGAEVLWDSETRAVTIKRSGSLVKLTIDSKKAFVNGKEKELDSPPEILNGRTLVPLRFISENMGMNVQWVPEKNSVVITE